MRKMRKQHISRLPSRGVTLVEILIVLVVIGLLLGGILKGQELINSAKVRTIADRQGSIKVAWFAFIDRYQALPGDFIEASQHLPGSPNGDGNGLVSQLESPLAFQHLTSAGYLRCPQCTAAVMAPPSAANSLQNYYGGVMAIFLDSGFYAARGGNTRSRLLVHTGPRIPSNIISELDRKLDDGIANTGAFVMNEYDVTGTSGRIGSSSGSGASFCTSTSASAQTNGVLTPPGLLYWRYAQASPPIEQNCGGSIVI